MPKAPRSIRLQRLQGQVGDVAYEMTKVHFAEFRAPEIWRPAVNAYRCEHCIRICVDLAGVAEQDLQLELLPGRLIIRGHRAAPEPEHPDYKPMQVLAMEIDHGYFERQLKLPLTVEREHVRVEQRNGLLWVHLPVRRH
jgi:HSP20 family molecular chaperone IbpA